MLYLSSQYIMLYLFCTEECVLYGSIESIDYAISVSYRSDCLMWFHRVHTLCCICFVQKTVLCGSIKTIHYAIFILYSRVRLMWFHRVKSLCYIRIKKWPSNVVPPSQYIMLYLFHTEVAVLCGSIESIHYVIFV